MAVLSSPSNKFKGVVAAGAVALILFIAAAIFGDHGFVHLLRMRNEQHRLEQTAFALQQHNEHLRQYIQRLRADDRYLERLARERWGGVKKGEILYRIAPTPAPPG